MKERQSNIELLRIISMLMVVLLHANYFTIGAVARADVLAAPVQSFVRMFLEQTCIVAVDVFVLISGWFGIRPSLKGAGSILYQVVFFGLIVLLPALIFHAVIPWKNVIKVFFGGVWYCLVYSLVSDFIFIGSGFK